MTRVLLVLLLLLPLPARSEPRFALREGLRCAHCHVNRTGGGMRTPYGATFAQSSLPTFRVMGAFDPRLGESVSYGANLRLRSTTRLAASTSIGGSTWSTTTQSSFEIPEGNLYIRADPLPDHLTLYFDETVAPEGASAREAFVMLHGLPLGGYLKAGRILLPYGLRLPDDTAFIRQETGFTYANQDLGVELGIGRRDFALSVAVSNGSLGGSDPNVEKQVTAQAEYVAPWLRAGASFAWNDTSSAELPFETMTAGGHLGVRLGRLVALAEVDWIHGASNADSYDSLALYTEADFEAVKGLHLRFVFEAFDPLLSLDENTRDRFVGGVSWMPIELFEIRAEVRINRDIPQRVEGNADEVLVEIHGFL